MVGTPSDFTVENNVVYGATSSGVFAVNASNGNELWNYEGNSQFGTLITDKDFLYVSSTKGVCCFNAGKGVLIWDYQAIDYNSNPTDGSMVDELLPTTPTLRDGIIYFGWNGPQRWLDTTEHKFYAINAYSGEVLWTDTLAYRFQATPVVYNDTLYLGGSAVTTKSMTGVGAGAVIALTPDVTAIEQKNHEVTSIIIVLTILIITVLLSILFIIRKTRKR
ncbi:MAG: PQQ-binding-like beta-propeller repeat protein [Candidatus Bathyarchaeota archaeon]|nr:PQQ-binding-like beta-propeller repeat protein [Candidatus Bathyarchaeota archaeon]